MNARESNSGGSAGVKNSNYEICFNVAVVTADRLGFTLLLQGAAEGQVQHKKKYMKKLLVCVSSALLVAGCASHRSAVGGAEAAGGAATTSEASSATSKGAGARVIVGGSANSQLAPEDARFVREAAQAGLAEVKMGNLAMQNAQDQNVKTYAQKLVKDNTAASQELQQIAGEKGMQLPTVLNARDTLLLSRLSSLKGTEFDRSLEQNAVTAHEQAVKLFQQEAQSGQDPELKVFAQKTLPTLQEHLAMARQMDSGKHNYNDLNNSGPNQ